MNNMTVKTISGCIQGPCLFRVEPFICLSKSLRSRKISSTLIRAGASELEPPDVRKLAKLAQIRVTDEEVADWEPKIRKTIEWFDQLQKIDVEGVEPCTRSSLANLLAARKDIPDEFQNRASGVFLVESLLCRRLKTPKDILFWRRALLLEKHIQEALLDSVPEREGPYVKVPKIL